MQYLPYLLNGAASFAIGAPRANGKREAIAVCTKLRSSFLGSVAVSRDRREPQDGAIAESAPECDGSQSPVMAARGAFVDHATVHRCALKIVPVPVVVCRQCKHPMGYSWRVDEMGATSRSAGSGIPCIAQSTGWGRRWTLRTPPGLLASELVQATRSAQPRSIATSARPTSSARAPGPAGGRCRRWRVPRWTATESIPDGGTAAPQVFILD
ncbi:hypothetical protein ACEQUB_03541 [Ralstonia syzygii]